MSNAKREYGEFHRSVAAGRAASQVRPAGSALRLAPEAAELRVVEAWDVQPARGGDPYNGIGARAAAGRPARKSA